MTPLSSKDEDWFLDTISVINDSWSIYSSIEQPLCTKPLCT
jgi:hypothetical protein